MTLSDLNMESLYRYDAGGLMLTDNEPDGAEAPRLAMLRTREGNLWRFGHALPEPLRRRLDALCAAVPVADDLRAASAQDAAIRALLAEHAPIAGEYRGPAYAFDAPPAPSAQGVLLHPGTQDLLDRHFPGERYPPEAGPVAVVVADGVAVARCFCARLTARAAHAGLETAEAYRGRGYAVAAVATWAAAVFASGRLPLYGTTWENQASQGVARRLGLRLYGEDWSVR